MPTPRTMVYQDFELTAVPRRLKSGQWKAKVRIRLNEASRDFTADKTFDSEEEAVVHSLDFGRKIIDGDAPEVSDLWIT